MILEQLASPKPGEHCAFMGNTGEGKTVCAVVLLLAQPNVIVLNTSHHPIFSEGEWIGSGPTRWFLPPCTDEVIKDDERIFKYKGGRVDYRPSDKFINLRAYQERFFAWFLNGKGQRVVYIDEVVDICESAKVYPWNLMKLMKRGRYKKAGLWVSTQEPVRAPAFLFGQAQNKYVYYLGWGPYRKLAEEWLQQPIPWEDIPERSHKFFVKTPKGFYGPQNPIGKRNGART
jgi:hypothetical protein